ncbi:MAG: glutamine--fructose-6-phosphate transaminase (isomerizing) [Candidatus Paceibacterota bacterium]|jgi:glucosamine--fructose-6-phosphate aminotransferase (isomerizing)
MCGIFSYVGEKEALSILIDGLTSLEYRGYDSAGIYLPESGSVKSVGAVNNLRAKITSKRAGKSGIAHLRWATHGEPTEKNAHPHSDCEGNFWVVHNGIIENYQELKKQLISKGHRFVSDTDTEVLAHLMEENFKKNKDFEKSAIATLKQVQGTYGIVFASKFESNKIIAARMGAPVVIGIGENERFVASDASPILRHTKQVIYLHDGDIAVLTANSHKISSLNNIKINRVPETIEWHADDIKKGGFKHFMLKEIMEESETVRNTIRGRLISNKGLVKLGGLESISDKLKNIKRIIIVGCGTAYYAGLAGEYMIEEYAGIPVEVEVGSEFRYRNPIIDEETLLLAISQSGETADTLEAIREAKRKGALTMGIVNTVGSTIARETDAGIYNHAGPEIGVASTKAFVSQLTSLVMLTVFLGRQRKMSVSTGKGILLELELIPEKIEEILKMKDTIRSLAKKYKKYEDFLFIGRKYNNPVAYEGALKLKEVSYVHAEGCGAGEMKHGPLAMITEDFPTVAICLNDSVYEKMVSNIQEIKARKGDILAIVNSGDKNVSKIVNNTISIPKTIDMLSPILSIVPLQLFAYYFAVEKGHNVDRPRNLAKSVTVE